jgi:hypothetical protein
MMVEQPYKHIITIPYTTTNETRAMITTLHNDAKL